MRYIEARVSEDAALRFFHRRRLGNLYGLLRRRSRVTTLGGKSLPYMERVWLPHYRIDIRVVSHRGPGQISVSVEGHSGSFAIFQMHEDLVEGNLDEELFPPALTQEEAVETGRRELLKTILRRRGQQEKPYIEDTLGVDIFYYPFWVYYFRRRGRYLDIRLQDAISGERGGNRTKMGLLNAFAKKARERRASDGAAPAANGQ